MVDSFFNDKPSKNFDQKYNTCLSQDYVFPFNLTADAVWIIIKTSDITDDYTMINNILDNLDFPYIDVKTLSFYGKKDVLMGMASCFNSDDIVWYVQGNVGCSPASRKVEEEIHKELGIMVTQWDLQWVVSEKTWMKMKEQLLLTVNK
jgi:hypothetical protein